MLMKISCWLRSVAAASLPVFLFFFPSPSFAGDPEFVPLFDGKTLDGWEHRGDGVFRVEDGVIVGENEKGRAGWLCTIEEFGDFILELEVKIENGNSGVQIRSGFNEKGRMVGYQIEVDPSPRAWSGGFYDEGRRGWLQNLDGNEPARKAFKRGEWNHYRIEAIGDSFKSWVNGVPAADYIDSMDLKGIIALQIHSGNNVKVSFRNLRIKDLGVRSWKPLWDGETCEGWHEIGKAAWTIENGAIVGRQVRQESEYGHLVSDARFDDFTVKLDFKALQGNSGLYFRVDKTGFSGVSGFQAEIDASKDVGGLYETNGRAWVIQPSADEVKKWFRPGEWNTMTVSAHGRRIAVDVNGHQTAELRDDPGRLEGHLALQVHGADDVHVLFRNINILGEPAPRRRSEP
jgi:hypothetical protein